jgi:predicted ferric reductase
MLYLFFLPTTKAYVEFIGREKARAYLQSIYSKVKQRIQRELSHTIKSRCACVNIWWIYIVANLILLCFLETYLSFETWKHLQESKGYLIYRFFLFRRASKYSLF